MPAKLLQQRTEREGVSGTVEPRPAKLRKYPALILVVMVISLGLVLSSALGWCEADVCEKTARILLNAATVVVQNATVITETTIDNRTAEQQ